MCYSFFLLFYTDYRLFMVKKQIITESFIGRPMSSPYHISYWYGGCHTCHAASGATAWESPIPKER